MGGLAYRTHLLHSVLAPRVQPVVIDLLELPALGGLFLIYVVGQLASLLAVLGSPPGWLFTLLCCCLSSILVCMGTYLGAHYLFEKEIAASKCRLDLWAEGLEFVYHDSEDSSTISFVPWDLLGRPILATRWTGWPGDGLDNCLVFPIDLSDEEQARRIVHRRDGEYAGELTELVVPLSPFAGVPLCEADLSEAFTSTYDLLLKELEPHWPKAIPR